MLTFQGGIIEGAVYRIQEPFQIRQTAYLVEPHLTYSWEEDRYGPGVRDLV